MEIVDIMWISSFITLLISLHLSNKFVVKSLKSKPLGKQTIFDIAIIDTFCAMKFYGTVACFMCISARFDWIRNVFIKNKILLTIVCSTYSFGFTCLCISASCLFIIRIFCILNLTFLEETVGENKVRLISNFFVVLTGMVVTFVFNVTEEVNSGSPVVLMTLKIASTGNLFNSIFQGEKI